MKLRRKSARPAKKRRTSDRYYSSASRLQREKKEKPAMNGCGTLPTTS